MLISVVVPTYNRHGAIARCLEALAAQTLSKESFEVVVVDDGSPVPVRGAVAAWRDRLDARTLEQANQGPATARNAGAFAARGAHIAFTDDDCLPEPDWLSNLARHIARNPAAGIGGRIVNALPDSAYSTGSQLLVEYLYEYFNTSNEGATFFITSNLSFPTEAFREMGGFDTSFPLAAAEDRDICDRWVERKGSLIYAGDAVVRHAHPLRLKSFWRQHYNYGRGAYYLQQARANRGESNLRVEPVRFYFGLVTYPWKRLEGSRALAGCVIAALSQVAYLAGFLRERFLRRA
ncbi:MAG: glycosyltransferase [Gemmatimonadales bacterium]|nr:glycosyltransferase [Gemmatimonadales bacterium]